MGAYYTSLSYLGYVQNFTSDIQKTICAFSKYPVLLGPAFYNIAQITFDPKLSHSGSKSSNPKKKVLIGSIFFGPLPAPPSPEQYSKINTNSILCDLFRASARITSHSRATVRSW